jgi:hypothetical protein
LNITNGVISVYINLDSKSTTIYRSIYTLLNAFSAVGGFFGLAFPIGKILTGGYSELSFKASMVSSLLRY